VLVACAVAGAAALLAASRVWLRLAAARTAPLPALSVPLTGREVEPLVPAVGVVALAGVVALLATGRRGRLIIGGLLAASGLGMMLRSLPHLAVPAPADARELLLDQGRATGEPAGATITATVDRVWPVLAALAGAALLAGGLVTVVRCRRWPGMSGRYDRRVRTAPAPASDAGGIDSAGGDASAWEALDRGEDPTAG
jgi:uncharacterized membrane protein (TIGR02234 family)